MTNDTEIWELRHGDTLIGRLTVYDHDDPWYSAHFEPTTAFDAYRPLFHEGAALRETDDTDRWNVWYDQLRGLGLHLLRLRDSTVVNDFILYIQGSEADFRPHFNG